MYSLFETFAARYSKQMMYRHTKKKLFVLEMVSSNVLFSWTVKHTISRLGYIENEHNAHWIFLPVLRDRQAYNKPTILECSSA